jgi:hypothetical protein
MKYFFSVLLLSSVVAGSFHAAELLIEGPGQDEQNREESIAFSQDLTNVETFLKGDDQAFIFKRNEGLEGSLRLSELKEHLAATSIPKERLFELVNQIGGDLAREEGDTKQVADLSADQLGRALVATVESQGIELEYTKKALRMLRLEASNDKVEVLTFKIKSPIAPWLPFATFFAGYIIRAAFEGACIATAASEEGEL